MSIESDRLADYLKDIAKVLEVLSEEIKQDKKFTKESEELLSKVGSNLLFKSASHKYFN